MGDMAGLPVMSGPDAIVLGEKINKEALIARTCGYGVKRPPACEQGRELARVRVWVWDF